MQIKLSKYNSKEKVLNEKEKHKDAKFIEELTFAQLMRMSVKKNVAA